MYRDKRNILRQTEKELVTTKALIIEFDKLKTITNDSAKQIWNEIVSLEKVLDDIVHEITERYSNNIEKNLVGGLRHSIVIRTTLSA